MNELPWLTFTLAMQLTKKHSVSHLKTCLTSRQLVLVSAKTQTLKGPGIDLRSFLVSNSAAHESYSSPEIPERVLCLETGSFS